ncbi:hypothetical protein [Actinokineospora xionganensis]|uniref:Uncharacterized protein n=1 Tax=Actinokineospora xionganensis TaxID=2684470 RepID=A0ABR7L2C3_9PSEU|nr:hypothetical protein [Actinokineospora xionganensis]MBC6446833.1 hypothetical protein [Actinokineospora xionganensis]
MGFSKSAVFVATTVAATLISGAAQASAAPELPGADTELRAELTEALAEGGTRFVPLSPTRVLDTRNGTGVPAAGPVGPAGSIEVSVAGKVPADAVAVALNVTGTGGTANTYITVWPSGLERPLASNVNLAPGETRPNGAVTEIGLDGFVSLYNNAGKTHLIADLAGYYTESTIDTAAYSTVEPVRIRDTRNVGGAVPAGQSIEIDFSAKVPASATAVTINLTGVGATQGTFVTAWPTGTDRPTASSLNLSSAAATPNQAIVALGADRKISLFNNAGSTHLIVDLVGYYSPESPYHFYPVEPWRNMDTRPGGGLDGGYYGNLPYTNLPAEIVAFTYNVTGTNTTANTFVTVWPAGIDLPTVSNLNLAPGQTSANMATVGVGYEDGERAVSFYNNAGYVDLIVDVSGVFATPPPPPAS